MIAALVFLLLAIATPSPADQAPSSRDEPTPFLVGVLRRDGIVTPFASFDGKNWNAPWPADLHFVEIPFGLESVPGKWWGKGGPIEQMTAWVDGVSRGPVRLSRPIVIRPMCQPRLGLASDYQSAEPAPPPVAQPFPKDGLTVSGKQRVDPIEVIARGSPERVKIAALLSEPFNAAEDEAVEAFTQWKHPVRRDDRRKLAVDIEALYRAPMDEAGWTAYYVEAARQYAPGAADQDCGLVTSASGWVIIGPDGKSNSRFGARVTYCDRRGVTYMLPLGLLKVRGRTNWVYQLSGYGREVYGIVHPRPKAVTQEAFYSSGECPL